MNERFLSNYEEIRCLMEKYNMCEAENHHILEDITAKGQTVLDRIDDIQKLNEDKKALLDEIINIINCDIEYELENF